MSLSKQGIYYFVLKSVALWPCMMIIFKKVVEARSISSCSGSVVNNVYFMLSISRREMHYVQESIGTS